VLFRSRFHPIVDLVRSPGGMTRRITMRGHDGSYHPFSVQQPAFRQCRREERILQLLRLMNSVLDRKTESRKRDLSFHIPAIIPLAPQARLVEDDPSYISLLEVYEDHCIRHNMHRDDHIILYLRRMKEIMEAEDIKQKTKVDLLNLKTEVMDEIKSKMVPEFVLSEYMSRNMKTSGDLWLMRKRFTSQMASMTFLTYVFCIGQRTPGKFFISRKTGSIWACDLAPTISNSSTTFANQEAVPFRFTPNLQHFINPIGIEGAFTSAVLSIAKSLTEGDLQEYLSVFVRDELNSWLAASKKAPLEDKQVKELVATNVDLITRRAQALACNAEKDKNLRVEPSVNGIVPPPVVLPCNQTILDLISQAVNPLKLAQMDLSWTPNL